MARKMIGVGTQLAFTPSTSSSSFTTVGSIVSAKGPGGDADDVETTTLDDTNYKTFARGLADGGELQVTLAYGSTDSANKKLGTLYKTGALVKWKTTFSATAVGAETFTGYVKSMGREGIEAKGMITRTMTIKVSGTPAFPTT